MKKIITSAVALMMLVQLVFVNSVFANADTDVLRTYFDCDFSDDGYEIAGSELRYNGEKIFGLEGTNAADRIKLLNGALDMDYTAMGRDPLASSLTARYTVTTSRGDLKGTDSGLITAEADLKLGNWRASPAIDIQFLYDTDDWSHIHNLQILVDGGEGIKISYTDKYNVQQTVATGVDWNDLSSVKHFKISMYPDYDIVNVEIDGKSFVIDDIKNICFIQYVNFRAVPYGMAVSKASCYKESLGAMLTMDGLTLSAEKIGEGSLSIWRSLDGANYYKVTDGGVYEIKQAPYPQYFKARIVSGSSCKESPVKAVDAFTSKTVKRTYYDCDFGEGYAISGNELQYNGEKVFSLEGTNAADRIKLLNGVLDMDYTAMGLGGVSSALTARYTAITSRGDLKGTDSGVITTEADLKLGNWRAYRAIDIRFLYGNEWEYTHNLQIMVAGGEGIKVAYTDINGAAKTLETGLVWNTNFNSGDTKHFKISIDVDKNIVTVEIDGKPFVIDDIRNIYCIQYIDYVAHPYAMTVDNASCYKYEERPLETKFEIAEKLYLTASDLENSVENGTAVTVAYTNDSGAREYTLIAAAYDETGALAETAVVPVTLNAGTGKAYTAHFSKEYPSENIKVYSWNMESLKPVFLKLSFTE